MKQFKFFFIILLICICLLITHISFKKKGIEKTLDEHIASLNIKKEMVDKTVFKYNFKNNAYSKFVWIKGAPDNYYYVFDYALPSAWLEYMLTHPITNESDRFSDTVYINGNVSDFNSKLANELKKYH
ncbi:hypothetical protein DOK76_12920 [Vagococcus sp. DIV0080]|uniref:Uncharacterized protein n=1 Tax=Candidatus Vagococcus giribetii TaxID=2230876 RepID=A0ABS3HW34_9ENTE|nr:hypothetical protein [Vagococcus sp. DIV0080]MBO0477968.1 hypothetical protein [Vagococcus sp. DIV0080]